MEYINLISALFHLWRLAITTLDKQSCFCYMIDCDRHDSNVIHVNKISVHCYFKWTGDSPFFWRSKGSLIIWQASTWTRLGSKYEHQTRLEQKVCSTDVPSQTPKGVRSQTECSVRCSLDVNCSGVNWRQGCEIFSYPTDHFITVPGCVHFYKGKKNNKLAKFRLCSCSQTRTIVIIHNIHISNCIHACMMFINNFSLSSVSFL